MLRRARRAGVGWAFFAWSVGTLAPLPATAQTTVPATTTTAAAAATPSSSTAATTTPPESTTTAASTTTTSTTLAPTTTTTALPPPATSAPIGTPAPWTLKIPGPPPPAPPPPSASPADIALANLLEVQISTQSQMLDVLAERYDRAQQAVVDATTKLSQIQDRIAMAESEDSTAQAGLIQSEGALKVVALDAYIGAGVSSPQLSSSVLLAAYERGMARAVSETALGKAFASVKQLQQAQRQLKQVQQALAAARQQAVTVNNAARLAAQQSQANALAAAQQQTQLLATLSKAGGNIGPLVAAAQAARAQAAYNRFTTQAGVLDFAVLTPLPGALAQTGAALQIAMAQVGKPYVWGGNGPDTFDCSGLMKWAWAQVGVTIPRVAADQQSWTTPVPISQLAPGDLVFFANPAHHVGMYVGNGLMVNAPHTGANVGIVPIWWDDLAGFGRIHQP